MSNEFLYDFQLDAVKRMFTGCILNGGTGSGKSLTSLFYYMKEQGGWRTKDEYALMKDPKDLYIITTAKKRNDKEWEKELSYILLSTSPEANEPYHNKVVVDSWQKIGKYVKVENSFFIFDEDKVTGNGAWVKSFLQITKRNDWVILSASPGDRWEDFEAVFIANKFFRNVTEMRREHYIYSRFTKYPKVDRYINEYRLMRLRDKILIDMDYDRHTVQHHKDIYCSFDRQLYKSTIRNRWDYEKNEPIQQASGLCYALRKIVNSDESRVSTFEDILSKVPRAIVFYSFDYELDILRSVFMDDDGTKVNRFTEYKVAEYNGHRHEPIPDSDRWVYLVNYMSGAEGFNCITCDTIIFYSQNYSYKTMMQAAGRIDRLTSPYSDLYFYHLTSRSSIDLAISKALADKKKFNESKWAGKWEVPKCRFRTG